MGLSCKILKVNDQIEIVEAPNGEESFLYAEALSRLENQEAALNIWTLPYTLGFKEVYGNWETGNSSLTLDENGEPGIETVLQYSKYIRNKGKKLSKKQEFEVANNLIGTDINSFEELFTSIRSTYYPKGVFEFDRESLLNSGIYSESEVDNLLTSTETQIKVKELVEIIETQYLSNNFDNLDTLLTDFSTFGDSTLVDTDQVIGLGRFKVENPILENKEIFKVLEGVTTEVELNNKLGDLATHISSRLESDYDFKEDLLEKLQNIKAIPEFTIKGDSLVSKKSDEFLEQLKETLLTDQEVSIGAEVKVLNDADIDLWESSNAEIKNILKQVESKLVDNNIDVIGLSESLDSKSRLEILEYLEQLELFVNSLNIATASEQDLLNFNQVNNLFFGKEVEEVKDFTNVKEKDRNLTLVKVKSSFSEIDTFTKFGLIKIGKDLYHKVNVSANVDTLMDSVYSLVQRNENIFPKQAYYPHAFDRDNTFNLGKLRNIENKDKIIKSIKQYIANKAQDLDVQIIDQNLDSVEKLALYKTVFGHPLVVNETLSESEELYRAKTFTADLEYLKSDFKADFYNFILKEKLKNSNLYNNALKHFKISESGIELRESDFFTLREIQSILPDNSIIKNLKQYTKISSEESLSNLFPTETLTEFDIKDYRKVYANNKTLLPSYRGQYEFIEGALVIPFSNETFVRINNRVFERVANNNTSSIYSELPTNTDPFYKDYQTNISKPNTIKDLNLLDKFKSNTDKASTFLTKKEKDKLNKELYGCQ